MGNRRTTKLEKWGVDVAARLWETRGVFVLAVPYLLLLSWLFSGTSRIDLRPAEIYAVPEIPLWTEPDDEHWFGTTASGVDLFELARHATAGSVAVAVVCSFFGIGLALLLASLFAFDPSERRFRPIFVFSRAGFLLPAMVALVIFAGGSGGSLGWAMFGMVVVSGLYLTPMVATWFEEGMVGNDRLAGFALGLTRSEMVLGRVFPKILRRLVGMLAQLVPVIVLVEMALSFLGFAGDRLGLGAMIAYGQESIIEAPWLAVFPGILAAVVVGLLAALGWMVARVTRSGILPRLF